MTDSTSGVEITPSKEEVTLPRKGDLQLHSKSGTSEGIETLRPGGPARPTHNPNDPFFWWRRDTISAFTALGRARGASAPDPRRYGLILPPAALSDPTAAPYGDLRLGMPVAWKDHLGVAHLGTVYALLAPGMNPLEVAPQGTRESQFPSGVGIHPAPRAMVAIPGRRRQVHYRTPVVSHLLRNRLPVPEGYLDPPDAILPVGTQVCWRNHRTGEFVQGTILAHCPAGSEARIHLPSNLPIRQFRGSLTSTTDRYLVCGPNGLFFAPLASHVERLKPHAA